VLFVVTVEKVTALARLLSVSSIQNNHRIKTSLAHAACYLIGSLQDINLYVVERTALYLETIKASSIKVLWLSILNGAYMLVFGVYDLHVCIYCHVTVLAVMPKLNDATLHFCL